jgi:NAD(P)-dependent dehydrogenase (short-subunit alcohol dehydrogenase family)
MGGPLEGRVAFITGGGKGIGRAIAERLCREGARVAICGRDEGALREVLTGLGESGRAYSLDVRSRPEVERAVERAVADLGGLDFLVNNAGTVGSTPIDSEDDERWHGILETNLTGTWHCTRAALRYLRPHAGARIVNVSSVLGKFGVAGSAAYCAAKHGLIGFTRAVALELAPRGIAVNAICPGWVETEMAAARLAEIAQAEGKSAEEARERATAEVPQKRFLEPSEVAGLALYLCLPESKGVTGQAISICGGQTAF